MKKLFILLIGASFLSYSCSSDNENSENIIGEEVQQAVQDVDVNTFFNLIENNDGQVLDVRTPEEWAEGLIAEDAIKINFYDDDFSIRVADLDKNMPVYVYCKAGGRSSDAAEQMQELGFKQIFNLDGGITDWMDEGKPIIK